MRSRLVLAAFALLLAAPWLAGALGVRPEAIENRAPAPRPAFRADGLLDPAWTAEFGAWVRDAIPLRSQAISLDSWIDYRIFGDSPSPEVLVGRDGWLFLRDSLRWPCDPRSSDREVLESLAALARPGARGEPRWVLLLSPNKSSLYADELPRAGRRMDACASAARRSLRMRLAHPWPFVVVDLWSLFAREHAAGAPLFGPLERHWDDRTGVLQAEALVEALAPGLWDPSAVRSTGLERRPAELPLRFMNLHVEREVEGFAVRREGVTLRQESVPIPGTRWNAWRTTLDDPGGRALAGRTVVLHDSFMERSVEAFAAFAERVDFVSWNALAEDPFATARFLAGADRVVVQSVEDRRLLTLSILRERPVAAALASTLRD